MNAESPRTLEPYRVVAFNYADDSENRIHADDTAREYGFAGGLVPGVGDYAYLTRPVVEAWGPDWLDTGWIEAKFLKPVYHGDRVEARAKPSTGEPNEHSHDPNSDLNLELHDSKGQLCAVGKAGRAPRRNPPASAHYPNTPLPDHDQRPDASLEALAPGTHLGSLDLDPQDLEALALDSIERFRDDLALYQELNNTSETEVNGHNGDHQPSRRLHPAIVPDLGNRILTSNVRLGPWIHTATDTQHLARLDTSEPIQVRGTVQAAYEKRGHHIVELDLGLFGKDDHWLSHFVHTAIIRPRKLAS